MHRHILSIILENESGSLSRVVGLFSQRGYNIETLTVAPTNNSTLSCMTIQTVGDLKVLKQIKKQLYKLIDVLYVKNLKKINCIAREIMIIKIEYQDSFKEEIKKNITIFKGNILYFTSKYYIIEIVGKSKKINKFIKYIKSISKILELVRSGVIGISKSLENTFFLK